MADLTARQVASFVHQLRQLDGSPLPEPIGVAIDAGLNLTVVFTRFDELQSWKERLTNARPVSPPAGFPKNAEAFCGTLVHRVRVGGGTVQYHRLVTTVVYRP